MDHLGESLSLCSLITIRVAMRFGQLRLALTSIAAAVVLSDVLLSDP